MATKAKCVLSHSVIISLFDQYRYCTRLFTLDGKVSYLFPKTRNKHRHNVVRPLLEEYFCWLKTVHPEKGSKLEEAVRYSMNQEQQLTAFLDFPEVPISNNLAENAIRPFVVGRKNWLFCDSVKGAESSAIVYSIVETAKAIRYYTGVFFHAIQFTASRR